MNYREQDEELFALECLALFGVECHEKSLITELNGCGEHSPFMHEKMRVIAYHEDPDQLVKCVEAMKLESDVYKVVFFVFVES